MILTRVELVTPRLKADIEFEVIQDIPDTDYVVGNRIFARDILHPKTKKLLITGGLWVWTKEGKDFWNIDIGDLQIKGYVKRIEKRNN